MKAIDILFNKIDDLNTQLKSSKHIYEKATKACEIKTIANLICEMAKSASWSNKDEDYI